MTDLVEFERHGDVGVLRLKDARRRNALSTPLITDAIAILAESRSGTKSVRAIVVTGHDADFCAGADIRDMLETGWMEDKAVSTAQPTPLELFRAIEDDPRPMIAAVHGRVLGGGVELATACDLVVSAPDTRFMLPEVGLGVLPNTALARLPAIIGLRRTAELILTRRPFDAEEARQFGFVTTVVETARLIDTAVELAAGIVAGAPPNALAGVKRALRADGRSWADTRAILELMDTAEWREGTNAFTEKRKPNYEPFWSRS